MNFEGLKVTISALEIKALAAFSSTDETRPNLNGFWIDFGNQTASATDGHAAIAYNFSSRPRTEDRVLVPLAQVRTLLALCAASPSKSVVIGFNVSDGPDVGAEGATEPQHPIEKAFDECSAGRQTAAWCWAFNADYAARLAIVQRAATVGYRLEATTVHAPAGDLEPMLFTFAGGWKVLIMPMRDDTTREAQKQLAVRNALLAARTVAPAPVVEERAA